MTTGCTGGHVFQFSKRLEMERRFSSSRNHTY